MSDAAIEAIRSVALSGGRLLVLTGAGISAESGIPTFRGPEGFWTQGSRVYHPQELATWAAFSADPQLVWPWYLWRRQKCRESEPNAAHHALVEIERRLGDRFTLVTQNVDGLHTRAGSSTKRTYEIHGNIDFMRCVQGCGPRRAVPDLPHVSASCSFHPDWSEPLECTPCRAWLRPHVLWFDECYDEATYRFDSTIRAGAEADALVVVGTTGATTLPAKLLQIAQLRGIPVVDINPDDNPFARVAERSPGGWLRGPATTWLPTIADAVLSV